MSRAAPVVAIVGAGTDPQVRAVGDAVGRLGVATRLVDTQALEQGAPFAVDPAAADGALPVSAYVRSLPSTWPPLRVADDGKELVARRWLAPFMLAREREAVVAGMLLDWRARGVHLLNPPGPTGFAQNKTFQLLRARTCGVPIPATLVTNDPVRARAFLRRHVDVIAKPAQGGAITRAVDVASRIDAIRAAPVILQRRIDGDDVRLFLLAGRVLSCRAVTLEDERPLDFRASAAYQSGHATYAPVTLPRTVLRAAAAWARACGLVFAGIDVKRTSRGRFVFLECNSSPIFLHQEQVSGDEMSDGIARWLTGRPS